MTTMTRVIAKSITGTDIRQVADAIWEAVIALYSFYGRNFPYNMQSLKRDLAQILLWDMAKKISVQFYEIVNDEKVERLSYEFLPLSDPEAEHSDPASFPSYDIYEDWKVRLVAIYTPLKPVEEVREFFRELGWVPSEPLTRTGKGTTEHYAWFCAGGISISREIYHDFDEKTDIEEVEL